MSINSVIQRKGLGTNHSFMRQASYCFFLSCTKENFSSSHLLFHLQQVRNFETRCGFRSIIWCGVIMNLLKKDLLDSYIAPRNWQSQKVTCKLDMTWLDSQYVWFRFHSLLDLCGLHHFSLPLSQRTFLSWVPPKQEKYLPDNFWIIRCWGGEGLYIKLFVEKKGNTIGTFTPNNSLWPFWDSSVILSEVKWLCITWDFITWNSTSRVDCLMSSGHSSVQWPGIVHQKK